MKHLYVCPMHPEVQSDKPGHCYKCGMPLVLADSKPTPTKTKSWYNYLPLIVVILMITGVAKVLSYNDYLAGQFSWSHLIEYFMTGFFLVFSGFKLMDIKGFAEGYSTYDLLAKRVFIYGYLYPFIELAFGLSMLAKFQPDWLLWTEFGVMTFSGLGVVLKLARHEKFQCACLGTFLKVPLTYVTLIEDFGMAALALLLLWLR